jgi:hypothetical protein
MKKKYLLKFTLAPEHIGPKHNRKAWYRCNSGVTMKHVFASASLIFLSLGALAQPPAMELNYLATMQSGLSAKQKKACVAEIAKVEGVSHIRFFKAKGTVFFVCEPGCGSRVEDLDCISEVEYALHSGND